MAYTLRPLRRDDRPPEVYVRPRRWHVLAVVAMVMVGSSSGLWAFYHWMSRKTAQVEVPLIRAELEPTRRRPADPGGMEIPGQGTLVLDGKRTPVKVEQLLPPPEAPLPRPAVVETPPEPAADAPPPALPAPMTGAAVSAPPSPPTPTSPAPAVAAAVPPAPATAPAPAAIGKGYFLQLGAGRSAEGAKQEGERLRRRQADLLGTLSLITPRVDLGERGTFYRIQVGPIADAAQAEHRCNELKRRGVGCLLVKP
ncbi:MAG TPA: SPOR domain-containing protein [Stellaceae bacterium]|nr:SPOR domain-containing protein [Stellaceae bacterium]